MHLFKGNEEAGLEFLGSYVSRAWYYENVPAQFNEAQGSRASRIPGRGNLSDLFSRTKLGIGGP